MSELRDKITKIGNDAVRKAQQNSLKNGIANVYSKNNVIYFQLPDGTITQDVPADYRDKISTLVSE